MRLKILILPISLATVIVISIFYVKPYFSEMMLARSSLAEKQAQLADLKRQNQKLQQVKSEWEAMGNEKALVLAALPESENIDSYVSEITSRASRSGVLLSEIEINSQNSQAIEDPPYVCKSIGSESVAAGGESFPLEAASQNAATAVFSGNCLKKIGVEMTAVGSWEQMLNFFKYLEDMNRISNISGVNLASAKSAEGENSSDLLTANISANAFFKAKEQTASLTSGNSLANQGSFDKKAIKKIRDVVYSLYAAPSVSPVSERNLFK